MYKKIFCSTCDEKNEHATVFRSCCEMFFSEFVAWNRSVPKWRVPSCCVLEVLSFYSSRVDQKAYHAIFRHGKTLVIDFQTIPRSKHFLKTRFYYFRPSHLIIHQFYFSSYFGYWDVFYYHSF